MLSPNKWLGIVLKNCGNKWLSTTFHSTYPWSHHAPMNTCIHPEPQHSSLNPCTHLWTAALNHVSQHRAINPAFVHDPPGSRLTHEPRHSPLNLITHPWINEVSLIAASWAKLTPCIMNEFKCRVRAVRCLLWQAEQSPLTPFLGRPTCKWRSSQSAAARPHKFTRVHCWSLTQDID